MTILVIFLAMALFIIMAFNDFAFIPWDTMDDTIHEFNHCQSTEDESEYV